MSSRSFQSQVRVAVGLGLVALLVAGFALLSLRPRTPTTFGSGRSANSVCNQPAVVAAEATVPVLDLAAAAHRVTIPPGEPPVVARVNGDPITAVELEQRVQIAIKLHQQQLKDLPPGAPASIRAELEKTPNQIRQEMLDKLIDDRLWLQEGKRLGLVATADAARAEAQRQLQMAQTVPASDPTYVVFQAYLCVNQLDESTYPVNTFVVQGYQDALTIAAVKSHVQAGLPADTQKDHTAVDAAVKAYVLRLRQSGKVEVFIPTQ